MSDRKRAHEGNGDAGTTAKKLKSSDTSTSNGLPASAGSANDLIAQKRAEIAAKLQAMKNASLGSASMSAAPKHKPSNLGIAAPVPTKPVTTVVTPAASIASKLTPGTTPSSGKGTPATPGTPGITGVPGPGISDDLARRVAEAKKRVAEAQNKLAVKDNPYMALAANAKKKSSTPAIVETPTPGAGLKMAAHPLLLEPTTTQAPQSKKDRYKPMQPKFASIKANVRNVPTPPPPPRSTPSIIPSPSPALANPYLAASAAATATAGPSTPTSAGPTPAIPGTPGKPQDIGTGFEGAPRERAHRQFRFNPKGKYIALANQMRQEQQLEALKQRIAESARKAGLDGEIGVEKNIKRPPPPEAEWWDVALLPNKRYSDIDTFGLEQLNIKTQDSPVTIYIQHPIPIPAPGDKNKAELKPLKLTTKEQKKLRKRLRKEKLQDKRDRIRMGLLPPDPPKVRLANLMKVLTSDAIQDPTRVEARVRREVAMRKHQHEKMNAERKLTDDQRREKLETKKAEEEKKGIVGAMFKVKMLTDPSHVFKVRRNADQLALTGVCIFNPAFSVVYVEGAAKFIKNYKRLMLHRIDWTQPARPRGAEEVEITENDEDAEGEGEEREENGASASNEGKGRAPVASEGGVDESSAISLEDNKCWLIWEGAMRERLFTGFKARSCETDREAKELLGEMKSYWDMAKNWKGEEEELI